MPYSLSRNYRNRSAGSQGDYTNIKIVRRFTVKTPPATTPVSVDDAKAFLRVDQTEDDAVVLPLYIEAATEMIEKYSDRALITRTSIAHLDNFPWVEDAIWLAGEPLQSVVEIRVFADDDTSEVWDAQNYFVDTAASRVITRNSSVFPYGQRHGMQGEIEYVHGYGDTPADVPAAFKMAILHTISHMYENRDEGGLALDKLPQVAENLIESYTRPHIF